MSGLMLKPRDILRIDRLVYVPVIVVLIAIWAVVIDFKIADRAQLLQLAGDELYSSADTIGDAETALIENPVWSEAKKQASRDDTIQDQTRLHPGAHFWLETNGVVFAGSAFPANTASVLYALIKRDGFTVHAALPVEQALAEWRTSLGQWVGILAVLTVAALTMATLLARILRRNAIAEVDLRKRDAVLRTINDAATVLAGTEDYETVITDVLASIAAVIGVDRVTLREFPPVGAEANSAKRLFEWHRPDLPSLAGIASVVNAEFGEYYTPDQFAQAMRGESHKFYIDDCSDKAKPFVIKLGMLSSVIFAIIVNGRPYCSLSFADAHNPRREWTETENDTLRTLTGVMAAAMTRTQQARERSKVEAKLGNRDAILQAVTDGAAKLLNTQNPDTTIAETLAALGPALGLSRIYIATFTVTEDRRIFVTLTHDWFRPGLATAKGHPAFTNADVTSLYPPERFAKASAGQEEAYLTDDLPPPDRAASTEIGALASVAVPVMVDGEFRGNLVFADDSPDRRSWTPTEIATLKTLTQLVGAAFARAHHLEQRQRAMTNLLMRERALEGISQGITISDFNSPDFPVIYANPAFAAMVRYPLDELIGRTSAFLIVPDEHRFMEEKIEQAKRIQKTGRTEVHVKRKDNSTFLDAITSTVIFDQNGRASHLVSVHEDVTELRKREELLLEARRMESVGHLTGGIAHDFNNLLTAIKSNAEDLRDELKNDELLQSQAEIVLEAADRGAGLVAQLLAFARKQELAPESVAINALIEAFAKQIQRTMPANIEIETRLSEDLPTVHVDPSRLESAIQSLALNARDAMPDGGTITIETALKTLDDEDTAANAGVRQGTYVLVAVTDSGTGMSSEIVDKAFTPFFTTKEVGKGTGLGLSMVYGFVKQSGGSARIYSEIGLGTVVKMYLPVTAAPVRTASEPADAPSHLAGTGAILVVEDDVIVREITSARLKHGGYRVETAGNAQEAIDILKATPHFDLVFSDVVMPGTMNGAELIGEVRHRWPNMGVLLTSGYTETTIFAKVKLPPDVRLLSKPFSNSELASAVREALVRSADKVA